MRDIRFRAFKDGKMFEAYSNENKGHDAIALLINSSALELMQYTGLDDKNGNPIFEGDVVKVFPKIMVTDGFIGKIEINTDGTFVLGNVEDGEMSKDWGVLSIFEVEVIGNIYEDANLLDKQT